MKAANHMEYLTDLEKSLQQTLSPVRPNQVFVDELREKLSKAPRITLEENPLTTIYLIFTFGLFIGVFIFWLIRKLFRLNKVELKASEIVSG
jgi:hypothetical protein